MFKSESRQEKYLKEDAVRHELGCYINTDAIKNATVFSVERINITYGNTERTLVSYFNDTTQNTDEFELLISRADHKDLVNKLNSIKNTKTNEK
jgi:hypothetical protein